MRFYSQEMEARNVEPATSSTPAGSGVPSSLPPLPTKPSFLASAPPDPPTASASESTSGPAIARTLSTQPRPDTVVPTPAAAPSTSNFAAVLPATAPLPASAAPRDRPTPPSPTRPSRPWEPRDAVSLRQMVGIVTGKENPAPAGISMAAWQQVSACLGSTARRGPGECRRKYEEDIYVRPALGKSQGIILPHFRV